MTSQSLRIYLYKITFEEVSYYYYGVHKEKVFGEEYWGTPITHKWCWEFYTPKKQILQFFPYTTEGWINALSIEERLIKPFYNIDKWCLNASCNGKISLEVMRKTGKKTYEERKGIHSLTFDQRSEIGRRGGQKTYEEKIGIFSISVEERKEIGRKSGKKCYDEKKGIHAMTFEEKSKHSQKIGKKSYEEKKGIHAQSIEERKKLGKNTSSQKWMCNETGYISTPGGLSSYQKKRKIDTSKRIRII